MVIKYATGLMAGQPATIEIIEDPYKDNLDDFVTDLSDNIKEKFLASLSDDKTNAVINSSYSSISQTILFSNQPSLSQMESSGVG